MVMLMMLTMMVMMLMMKVVVKTPAGKYLRYPGLGSGGFQLINDCEDYAGNAKEYDDYANDFDSDSNDNEDNDCKVAACCIYI